MSANDNFSLNDDEELSLHDDASLDGSVPASNKGDAPAKPPQIITTNTLSNIKLPVLQKDDYDTWAMEMEHYLEYIDNEVWKVIQNGNSKKRVTKGKDGVYRVLPPTTQEEQFADEKERKARTLLLMAVPKDHLRHHEESKKRVTKGMDGVYRVLPLQLTQAKASSSKHKPSHSSGSYSSYTTSSSKATPTATPGLADEVIHSFLATNADDVDLIHEDLDQIDDLDLEEMDINWQIAMTAIKIKKSTERQEEGQEGVDGKMHVAFDKRKVECFNCHNTGHFARECKFKGSKEGSRQEAGRGQDFKPVRTEKEALMDIDVAKYDELQSEFGDQEAALVAHKIAGKPMQDINDIPYTADSKQFYEICCKLHYFLMQSNDSDGEQGTVSDHSVNDDPIPIPSSEQVTTSTQKTQPQVPKPQQTVDPSCAQHVKTPRQPIRTPVTPSPIPSYNRQNWNQRMERELGAGYSFERKPCFVCGSLSHLIKDCDYYEKKMAREAAFKSTRVFVLILLC
ncbi:ribonuclease H-like domain-containing protein [Tanacetum coccineum]